MNDKKAAQIILNCIDLTSLNKDDSISKIEELTKQGHTDYGRVASMCVFPNFIKAVKDVSDIKVATVINFPHGQDEPNKIMQDISSATSLGAQEVDIVFPYLSFLEKDYNKVEEFLSAISTIDKNITSKIILETSEIKKTTKIIEATKLCIEAGANFIKTSTGKTNIGATPEVANIILETIASHPKKAGFKASGGIKTLEDAKKYVILAQAIMGQKWLNNKNFRIGASSLLGEVVKCLSKT